MLIICYFILLSGIDIIPQLIELFTCCKIFQLFLFWGVINKAMRIPKLKFLAKVVIIWEKCLRVQTMRLYKHVFTFIRNYYIIFQSSCINLFPTCYRRMIQSFQIYSKHLIQSSFKILAILIDV